MSRFTTADLINRLAAALGTRIVEVEDLSKRYGDLSSVPEDYVVASVAEYEDRKYRFAVTLLNKSNANAPRGTGATFADALASAIARIDRRPFNERYRALA